MPSQEKDHSIDILRYWALVEDFTMPKLEKEDTEAEATQRTITEAADIPWLIGGQKLKVNKKYKILLGVNSSSALVDAIKASLGDAKVKTKESNKEEPEDLGDDHKEEPKALEERQEQQADEYEEPGGNYTYMLAFEVGACGSPLEKSLKIPDYVLAIGCMTQDDASGKSLSLDYVNHDQTALKNTKASIENAYKGLHSNIKTINLDSLRGLLDDVLEIIGWKKIAQPADEKLQNHIWVCDTTSLAFKSSEKALCNSFFTHDLREVIRKWEKDSNSISSSLKQYLTLQPTEAQREDLSNVDVLRKYVAPQLMAPARWPCAEGYTLNIGQQVAVNLALSLDHDQNNSIFSVNGPPGTGKTALLNDVISNIIVRRAQAIASLSSPADAFEEKPSKACIGSKQYTIWQPKEVLRGYEIVITSNNNSAVENITKQLPTEGAIDSSHKLNYFANLADGILNKNDCWGLCAAALGSQANTQNFFKKFWDSVRCKQGSVFSEQYAQTGGNWGGAKKSFQDALEVYKNIRKKLIDVAKALDKPYENNKQIQKEQQALAQQRADQEAALKAQEVPKALLEKEHNDHTKQRNDLKSKKPSLWSRLWASEEYQQWAAEYDKAVKAQKADQQALNEWTQKTNEIQKKLSKITQDQETLKGKIIAEKGQLGTCRSRGLQYCHAARLWKTIRAKLSLIFRLFGYSKAKKSDISLEEYLAPYRMEKENGKKNKKYMGKNLPDAAFWKQPDEELQQCSPWHCQELHQARAALFVAAMNLHHAFISAAAKQFRDNLKGINALLVSSNQSAANTDSNEAKEALLPGLWTTLCTVVPVISTTLASIRNLRGLGKESIGWLLIDEAGQVTPQAVVGALQRAKRVIAVGDPLQVPSIVTIHRGMNQFLREHYNLDPEWDVYNTTAQQLADKVNVFGAHAMRMRKQVWLGAPLRVHRRCEEPMFTISNKIVYDGLMIKATKKAEKGKSSWINVSGELMGKHWVPEEGEAVAEILTRMCGTCAELPDVYIISPFKEVVEELKKLLKNRGIKDSWVEKSVGTVHTVQGKEADGVILVLGASSAKDDEAGKQAREWASTKPNILNVAVTRAKDFCVVVGNHKRWSEHPHFKLLKDYLDVKDFSRKSSNVLPVTTSLL